MSTISVKLIDTEELRPGIARRCKVKIKGMDTFHTPNRGIVTSEANKHINITSKRVLNLPLENPIFELVHDFGKNLSQLHKRNGPYSNALTKINNFVRKFSGGMLILFYPRWRSEMTPSEKDLEYLADLQIYSELNYITLPECSRGMPYNDFTKQLQIYSIKIENESVTNTEKIVIPRISIKDKDEENFKKKFDYIIERDTEFPICLIEYAPYADFIANYDHIAKNCPENTLLHMFSTQRKHKGFVNAFSILHWLQTKGLDTFTVFQPHKGGGSPDISKIPLLKGDDLRFIECGAGEQQQIRCYCDYCQGLSVAEVINTDGLVYHGENKYGRSYSKAQSALRLHEIYLGTKEFENSQERIKGHDLTEYLKEKKLSDKAIGILNGQQRFF